MSYGKFTSSEVIRKPRNFHMISDDLERKHYVYMD